MRFVFDLRDSRDERPPLELVVGELGSGVSLWPRCDWCGTDVIPGNVCRGARCGVKICAHAQIDASGNPGARGGVLLGEDPGAA
jgi:hypothetical protein